MNCTNVSNYHLLSNNLTYFAHNFIVNADDETRLLFSTLSILSFCLVITLLFVYSFGDHVQIGAEFDLLVLTFAVVVTVIADLSYEKTKAIQYLIYEIIIVTFFGIIATWVGAYYYFDTPNNKRNNHVKPIGNNHANVSLFIWAITIPVALLEMFVVMGTIINHDVLATILVTAGLFQKVIQSGIYHFSLRQKVPVFNKNRGASLYLKTVALCNFSMWLESIILTDKEGHAYLDKILKSGYGIFTSSYAALLVEYRLLCCMIFVEHAIDIDKRIPEIPRKIKMARTLSTIATADVALNNTEESAEEFKVSTSQLAGCSYILGLFLIAMQFVSGLQFTCYLGPWTNIFGIIAEVMVLISGVFVVIQVRYQPY